MNSLILKVSTARSEFWYNEVLTVHIRNSINIFNKVLNVYEIGLNHQARRYCFICLSFRLCKLRDFYNCPSFPQVLTYLTHLFPMHPFSTPSKDEKNRRFSDDFRGRRKGALKTNGLKKWLIKMIICSFSFC